ncbi:MAG: nucleotidyl transferase AbiEii/AbiGii toxin family protein [Muribaculaceae bacterium]|nr:nucleotidyl transferase AbiEii/AbiGii toxin family protein [Muribaculaceae bacterium]
MMSSNLNRLKIIAEGLGELCRNVVFVGGTVAELYADDPASTDIRPTMDVDCVVELATYGSLQEFEGRLRKQGFENDIESGVICRWKYNGETVDIMPDRDSIYGFTNQWYRPGFQHRIVYELPNGIAVNILPPLYYIGTKIEAIRNRGGEDLRLSHDFEDLIYVLNNCRDIISLFDNENNKILAEYISSWASEVLSRPNCLEEIECMLPYGEYDRVEYIIRILNHFKR